MNNKKNLRTHGKELVFLILKEFILIRKGFQVKKYVRLNTLHSHLLPSEILKCNSTQNFQKALVAIKDKEEKNGYDK